MAGAYATHGCEALLYAGQGIVRVYLVFEVDETGIADLFERLEDVGDRQLSSSDCDLAFFACRVGEVFEVYVVQARAYLADGAWDVCSGTRGMAHVDTAADPRVEVLDGKKHIQRRVLALVLRTMIVDRDTDVVLLHHTVEPRQGLVVGVTGHDH